jgi:peroxiredoxin
MTATDLETAPDFTFTDADGSEVRLSDLWSRAEKGIVLVFLRHFGCMFCRDHVAQLSTHHAEIHRRGFEVVAIGQGSPERSARFRADHKLPFPVLGDKERASYRLYGLSEGALGGFFSPGAYRAAIGAALRGNLPGKPDGSLNQNPGTFLIDRTGRILGARIGKHAGDIPSASEIVAWLDSGST